MTHKPTPTAVTPPKQPKKRAWVWAIIAIVGFTLIFMVGGSLLGRLFGPLGEFISQSTENSDYADRFAAYKQVNKTFTIGETMKFGPVDVTATTVTQNFQPSAEELAYIETVYAKDPERSYPRYDANATDTQYVQARFTIQYDASRKDQQRILFNEMDPFTATFNGAKLNDTYSLVYWIDNVAQPQYRSSGETVKLIEEGKPLEVVYLFKIPTKSEGIFALTNEAYSRTSSIVGTEGMPTTEFTYTLALW